MRLTASRTEQAVNDTEHERGDHLNRDKTSVFGAIQYLAWNSGLDPRQINSILLEQTKRRRSQMRNGSD